MASTSKLEKLEAEEKELRKQIAKARDDQVKARTKVREGNLIADKEAQVAALRAELERQLEDPAHSASDEVVLPGREDGGKPVDNEKKEAPAPSPDVPTGGSN